MRVARPVSAGSKNPCSLDHCHEESRNGHPGNRLQALAKMTSCKSVCGGAEIVEGREVFRRLNQMMSENPFLPQVP